MIDTDKLLDSLGSEHIAKYLGLPTDSIELLRDAKTRDKKLVIVLMNEKALGQDTITKIIRFV